MHGEESYLRMMKDGGKRGELVCSHFSFVRVRVVLEGHMLCNGVVVVVLICIIIALLPFYHLFRGLRVSLIK